MLSRASLLVIVSTHCTLDFNIGFFVKSELTDPNKCLEQFHNPPGTLYIHRYVFSKQHLLIGWEGFNIYITNSWDLIIGARDMIEPPHIKT